jgi:hypothetical protein
VEGPALHGGWSEANATALEKFREWPVLLGRFAALAEAAA